MRRLAIALMLLLAPAPALAAPIDDYVQLRVAIETNIACGGLKFFEHREALGAAASALGGTTEYSLHSDGRLSEEQYRQWLDGIEGQIAGRRAMIGCTQGAVPYLTAARGVAAQSLYKGLVLATHFSKMLPSDLDHLMLDPIQQRAVQVYDQYVQQLYGQNFPAFSGRQKELAVQELPAVNPFGGGFGEFGTGMGEYGIFGTPTTVEDMQKSRNARSLGVSAVGALMFEVSAETAGYVVRPRAVDALRTIPELRRADGAEPPLPVVEGPGYLLFDPTPDDSNVDQEELHYTAVLTPERRLRVMFYGQTALDHLADPTVTLYVRNEPLPPAVSSWEMFDRDDWREKTQAFRGSRLETNCFGGPCYEFAPEAADMLVRGAAGDYAELFVSPRPGDVSDPTGWTRSGRFSNFYTQKLLVPEAPAQ